MAYQPSYTPVSEDEIDFDKKYRVACPIDGVIPWGPYPGTHALLALEDSNTNNYCGRHDHYLVEMKAIGRPKKAKVAA